MFLFPSNRNFHLLPAELLTGDRTSPHGGVQIKAMHCLFLFFLFHFFLLKRYVRFFLLFPQKCVTHKLKGCFSTFPTARTANTRSNWIMPSLQACVCGLLSGFSSRQLQKQQHHILTSAFFSLFLSLSVMQHIYTHSVAFSLSVTLFSSPAAAEHQRVLPPA